MDTLLGFFVMLHSYDYFALHMSLLRICVSLDKLLQWICPVDYRSHLTRLYQVLHKIEVSMLSVSYTEFCLFITYHLGPQHLEKQSPCNHC